MIDGPRSMLGRSTVEVPVYGFGTAPIGNLFEATSDEDARAALDAAQRAGLNYFDTAPHYGVGLAEERFGQWAAERERSSFVLSTKVGRILHERQAGEELETQGFTDTPNRIRRWDFSASGIRESLSASCQRLGLEQTDIALLHDPDDHEADAYKTALPTLVEMRDEGVVNAIGAGMNQSKMLTRFVRDFDLDVVLCAGRYTLLDSSALNDLMPMCEERGTSVVIGGVYNSGVLLNPVAGATYNYLPAPRDILERAQRLAAVCSEFGVPLRAAAVQFPLAHPAVACVLVSGSNAAQVADNLAMMQFEIPPELWRSLIDQGLLPEGTPTPTGANA